MAGNKYINSNSGVLTEVTALQTSAGATDAGKIVALDDNGKLNASLGLGDKVDKVTGSSLVEDTKVTSYDNHLVNSSNPHGVTASQTGAYSTSEADALLLAKEDKSNKGVANGYASLDLNGKVPLTQISDSTLAGVVEKITELASKKDLAIAMAIVFGS